MSPFAAVAVKTLGAAGAAALLGMSSVQAASPTPSHTAKPGAVAVRQAVVEAEADVLGIKPETLVADLKAGQKVSDLARDKGMTKEQFETRLVASLRPRLEALVDHKVIEQKQADKVLDRISKGHIPFWNGIHRHHKK